MSEKAVRAILVLTGLMTLGMSGLVWRSSAGVAAARLEAEQFTERILGERARLERTPSLEQEVLVFREISGRMAAILPDEEGLNDLVRSLQGFSEDSGVSIRSLRRAAPRGTTKRGGDFREVSYTLELEGDAFELLSFLDLVERHERFVRVPRLEVDAARRQIGRPEGESLKHSIRLDVETFVFEPGAEAEPVVIEWADWKLERLRGEVSERRKALEPTEYDYRGRRGRRDPWLDPRLAPSPLADVVQSIQSQELSEFSERVDNAWVQWRALDEVSSSLEETRRSEELEVEVVRLEAEGRRLVGVQREGRSDPSVGGEQAAIASLKDLRTSLDQARGNRGPSIAHLREVCSAMESHALAGEHELALEAFAALEPDLAWIAKDPAREPLVEDLKVAAARSSAVLEFDALGYAPTGIAILDDRAAVLVAGRSVIAGDRVDDDVVVRSVTSEEVVFEYRGVAIARRVLLYSPKAGER